MKKRRKNFFIIKGLEYVEFFDASVILRKNVAELGNSRQVSRALKALEVRLKSRFRRKLAHNNRVLGIEGMIYAK